MDLGPIPKVRRPIRAATTFRQGYRRLSGTARTISLNISSLFAISGRSILVAPQGSARAFLLFCQEDYRCIPKWRSRVNFDFPSRFVRLFQKDKNPMGLTTRNFVDTRNLSDLFFPHTRHLPLAISNLAFCISVPRHHSCRCLSCSSSLFCRSISACCVESCCCRASSCFCRACI